MEVYSWGISANVSTGDSLLLEFKSQELTFTLEPFWKSRIIFGIHSKFFGKDLEGSTSLLGLWGLEETTEIGFRYLKGLVSLELGMLENYLERSCWKKLFLSNKDAKKVSIIIFLIGERLRIGNLD